MHMIFTNFLRSIRLGLRNHIFFAKLLRTTRIAHIGKRFYQWLIIKRGFQQVVLMDHTLKFAVSCPREIERIDSMAHEDQFITRMLDALRAGDHVYDIGANIGVISLLLASGAEEVHVDAFEPEPRNAAQLRKNIAINHMDSVIDAHEMALGAEKATLTLYVDGETGSGTHSLVARGDASQSTVAVPVDTAVSFAAGHKAPDLVKIDVEGAEVQVLEGMKPLLETRAIRDLFLELHPNLIADQGWDEQKVTTWMMERGYKLAWAFRRNTEVHLHYIVAHE